MDKRKENKPFHQRGVKYNGAKRKLNILIMPRSRVGVSRLAAAEASAGCGPNFTGPPDLMPKKDRKFISSRVRPTFGPACAK
jgi:hypothetical protein